MNNHGQLILNDLLLYIIIITIIVGIVFQLINTIDEREVMVVNNHETNKACEDALEMLMVELKENNSTALSYDKIINLKEHPELIHNILPGDYACELTVENDDSKLVIINTTTQLKSNTYVKQRYITLNYNLNKTPFKSYIKTTTCTLRHDNNWNCIQIHVDKNNLNINFYYLITPKPQKYIITNTHNEQITDTTNNNCINEKLKLLTSNTETLTIHLNNPRSIPNKHR